MLRSSLAHGPSAKVRPRHATPRAAAGWRSSGLSVAVVGLGNIGLFTAQLVARMPAVTRLVLVDKDVATPTNLTGQDFTAQEGQAGRPKVLLARQRIHWIRRDLEVLAVHAAVEDVPRGLLRADVLLACLDSKRARMAVNEIAWRLGIPWLDAGVQADGLLARVNVYVPGPDQPCLECAWDDRSYAALEQRLPCLPDAPTAPPTRAPAALGSLAAALQALNLAQMLEGPFPPPTAGRQLVFDARARRSFDARLRRNPACRFDHQTWAIHPLRHSPRELTVKAAFGLGCGKSGLDPDAELVAEPMSFVRQLACGCGTQRATLRLIGRMPPRQSRCPQCGRPLQPVGFSTCARLAARDCAAAELRRPLAALGFRSGDIFGVARGGDVRHYQLPQG